VAQTPEAQSPPVVQGAVAAPGPTEVPTSAGGRHERAPRPPSQQIWPFEQSDGRQQAWLQTLLGMVVVEDEGRLRASLRVHTPLAQSDAATQAAPTVPKDSQAPVSRLQR